VLYIAVVIQIFFHVWDNKISMIYISGDTFLLTDFNDNLKS